MNASGKNPKSKNSHNAQRTAARLAAVQAVYQMMANDQRAAAVFDDLRTRPPGDGLDGGAQMVAPDAALMSAIIDGVEERGDDLMRLITGAQNRRNSTVDDTNPPQLSPIEPLLRSILLCGSFELLAHHETDVPLIISDYLEVTHAFYDQGESKLVNGILDKISKSVRDNG